MKRLWKVGLLLALVAAMSVAVVGTAAAQEDDPETPPFGGRGLGLLWGGGWEIFDTVAETLKLTPVELFTELHGGKTLEEVSEAQGVDFESLQDVIHSSRQAQHRERIEQAVQDGKLTREQANWMLEGLELGLGRLGRGLRHGFGPPPVTE